MSTSHRQPFSAAFNIKFHHLISSAVVIVSRRKQPLFSRHHVKPLLTAVIVESLQQPSSVAFINKPHQNHIQQLFRSIPQKHPSTSADTSSANYQTSTKSNSFQQQPSSTVVNYLHQGRHTLSQQQARSTALNIILREQVWSTALIRSHHKQPSSINFISTSNQGNHQ